MSCKNFALTALLFMVVSPVVAAPALSIVPEGLQAGNWVWRVDVTPDLAIAPGSTPLALELGFRLLGAPLLGATNINPSEFDTENPGDVIFGWETLTDVDPGMGVNLQPVGLQVNTPTDEIFAAIGTVNFTTPSPKPFLQIIAQGPANGGEPTSTLQWLGAYGGNGRIAQLTSPVSATNFDIYSGTATQIPEPASGALLVIGVLMCLTSLGRSRP